VSPATPTRSPPPHTPLPRPPRLSAPLPRRLLLASRGCKVVVNDLGNAFDGTGAPAGMVADEVVAEIEAAGGTAVADHNSVLDGEAIVATALEAFGRLDVVVNNAGILTPENWNDLTLESWQRTIDINLTGVFSVCKAAWPVLVKQEYGRVVVTCSPAMYGSGVEAYAASKTGLIGLATSLQVILPTAPGVSNEGRSSPLLVPLPAVSWPWAPAWGSLEPSRRGGENAQKRRKNGDEMGEIRPKRCEGRELTKDQLASSAWPPPSSSRRSSSRWTSRSTSSSLRPTRA